MITIKRMNPVVKKIMSLSKSLKKEIIKEEAPPRNVKCFECGERGHVKSECPTVEKKNKYFKRNKDKKSKKAYIAGEDNEVSSSSGSKSKEYTNLALMASHHSDDEDNEVSNKFTIYENDAQGAIDELLNECKKLYKTIASQEQ